MIGMQQLESNAFITDFWSNDKLSKLVESKQVVSTDVSGITTDPYAKITKWKRAIMQSM